MKFSPYRYRSKSKDPIGRASSILSLRSSDYTYLEHGEVLSFLGLPRMTHLNVPLDIRLMAYLFKLKGANE